MSCEDDDFDVAWQNLAACELCGKAAGYPEDLIDGLGPCCQDDHFKCQCCEEIHPTTALDDTYWLCLECAQDQKGESEVRFGDGLSEDPDPDPFE